jgi:hypothetical protein
VPATSRGGVRILLAAPKVSLMRQAFIVPVLVALSVVTTKAAQSDHSTLILLMDASGSMKASDPSCLRSDAAELLLALTPDSDRFAVAWFGTRVVPLTNGVEVTSSESRPRIGAGLKRCAAADQDTDIGAALDYAIALTRGMSEPMRQAFPPQVVLFTDGRYEPANGEPVDPSLIAVKLEELKRIGATVHTLGLGAGADRTMLQTLSETTGGHSVYAGRSSDLISGFLEMARLLGRRWLLVDRQHSSASEFSVPAWVSEWRAVFVPERPGDTITGAGLTTALSARSYQVLENRANSRTVKVSTIGGRGRLLVDGSGALAFDGKLPATVPVGAFFACSSRLFSTRGVELGSPAFLDTTAVFARIGPVSFPLYDDGHHDDGAAGDGHWGGRCRVDAPGAMTWIVEMALPSLNPPRSTGTGEVLDKPIQRREPSFIAGLMRTTFGRPLVLGLINLTDVPLAGTVHAAGIQERTTVPPNGRVDLQVRVQHAAFDTNAEPLSFEVAETGRQYPLDTFRNWGGAWLPVGVAIFVGAVCLTMVFPRRTAGGSTLIVRSQVLDDDAEAFSAAGSIASSGYPEFREPLPEPFGRPGRFVAHSGLWKKGVLFFPEPWLRPEFATKTARTEADGFSLKRTTTWSATYKGYRVTYTLTPRL